MDNLDAKVHYFDEGLGKSSEDIAVVTKIETNSFIINVDGVLYSAKKAFSCFIEPIENDLVLIKYIRNQFYIFAVVERQYSDDEVNIKLPNKTSVKSTEKLSFEAASISNVSLEYDVVASKMLTVVDNMKVFAKDLYEQSDFKQIKSNQLLKEIADLEQSVIEDLRLIVKSHYNAQAKSINLVSDDDTNINAKSVSIC
ncbi:MULTISPECIES: DUF3540 domain-containing protein [unclassified Francisella]|uniref:DUF3540 domain-containing protein n=1 Tax=unclassified Francisella TaxID=2610885 RepID=UPI002E300045|nr:MULTISPECIES: DUF3540 domain-containing protein [unclassified Francisella]MED7818336.1 DUF3540 domain-containing protein [Francisella sp. 19S2-4]MED7829172.1 DUF3540 domain-containing protein [Francisella sp. 19S2-10]